MSNTYLSHTGAQLRTAASAGDQGAIAELARRAAKREQSGKWTIAAAKSQGRDDIVQAKLAEAASHKPAKAVKQAPELAFTRTKEVVPALKGKAVTKALTPRVDAMEQSILALAATVQAQNEALALICKKLGV